MQKNHFQIELRNYFYTLELYDSMGREVFDLQTACEAAEEQYGADWQSVFNGHESMSREDYLTAV